MAEAIDFEKAFRDIAVEEAARDKHLSAFTAWIVNDSAPFPSVPDDLSAEAGYGDVCAYVAEKYGGLEPEEMSRAIRICERLVNNRNSHGEA